MDIQPRNHYDNGIPKQPPVSEQAPPCASQQDSQLAVNRRLCDRAAGLNTQSRKGGAPIKSSTRTTPATRPGAAGPQSKKTYLIDNGTIREKSGKVQDRTKIRGTSLAGYPPGHSQKE